MKKPFLTLAQAQEIKKNYPTPFHIYDERGIRENARALKAAFAWNPGFKEYFAVKATPTPGILKLLREEGHVTMSADGALELTATGREIAERIYERHRLLTLWFTELGVSEAQAAQDACRVEHDISAETFQRLKEHFGGSEKI